MVSKTIKTFNDLLGELTNILEEDKRLMKENFPRVLAAKRKKFLQAIDANDQLDGCADVNIDDENLPYTENKYNIFSMTKQIISLPFDDSIVVNNFMKIKQPEFDLKTYISCVKGLYKDSHVLTSNMCYLLCHARDFSEPRNTLLTFSEQGTEEIHFPTREVDLSTFQWSPFTAKLMTLMDDLLTNYSQAKYQQLNMNVTYMVLLMTRKIFSANSNYVKALKKPKTHENFVNLCRRPLCERLADDERLLNNEVLRQDDRLFTLILYAYLNSAGRTRRVLLTTCVSHMEYTGLGLPSMFDKVVGLYHVTERRLWDLLCVDKCESMFRLADLHDAQRKGEGQVPPKTYTLFPYCRVLSGHHHGDLSCRNNKVVCYALAWLIDRKIGLDTSFMRKAHWTKIDFEFTIAAKKGKTLADTVYDKINT